MQVKKGNKIKLVKPMGIFTNIGEVCEVTDVTNDIISFKFGGCHLGQMSSDEADKYFELVKNVEKSKGDKEMFKIGDMIVVKESVTDVINKGEKFTINDIDVFDIAYIEDEYYRGLTIPVSYLDKYFNKVEKKKNTIYKNDIESLLNGARVIVNTLFGKCTIVAIQLKNGFIIVESSACVDPDNYDIEIGKQKCINKIIDKLWELEGYTLQKSMKRENLVLLSDEGNELHIQFGKNNLDDYENKCCEECDDCHTDCDDYGIECYDACKIECDGDCENCECPFLNN